MENNITHKFSGSFAGELRRELALHRTEFLMLVALVFLATFLAVMLPEYLFLDLYLEEWEEQGTVSSYTTPQVTLISALNIFFLTICVGASIMFSDLSTKEKRVATLMTPVSTRVSFFARFTRCVVFPGVASIVIFIFLDIARVVIFNIMTIGHETHFTTIWPYLAENPEAVRNFFTHIAVYPAFLCSVFMFGAIFWPRFSFPKTFCLILGILLVIFILCSIVDLFIDNGVFIINKLWFIALLWILSFVNMLLTYLRLKETDIND